MTDDRAAAIEALLARAADAHHVFERDELHGEYDQAWPAWYGRYIVANGLDAIVGHEVDADAVGELLQRLWDAFKEVEPKPTESWAGWTARRIATEL